MFSDFQCPACARTHPELKRVIAEYKDKVRFVVRDFPLENAHPNAFEAALAANAAHRQGKFVEYIEILYRNQEALDGASLRTYAEQLKLDLAKFEAAIADPAAAAEVKKDQSDGRSYGVGGTPTIFVNGVKVHRLSAPAFRDAIERALKK
jgi:protein-disulfide isomerase